MRNLSVGNRGRIGSSVRLDYRHPAYFSILFYTRTASPLQYLKPSRISYQVCNDICPSLPYQEFGERNGGTTSGSVDITSPRPHDTVRNGKANCFHGRHTITEISTESKFETLGCTQTQPIYSARAADRAASSTRTDELSPFPAPSLSPGFFFFLVLYFPGSFLN